MTKPTVNTGLVFDFNHATAATRMAPFDTAPLARLARLFIFFESADLPDGASSMTGLAGDLSAPITPGTSFSCGHGIISNMYLFLAQVGEG